MITWPAPADAAVLHGPAGEFVSLTEPHTESDPMALLAQFMVCFGTAVGRSAHYAVEASRHFGNEFVVLVGPSSKGRKGSSWDHVERLMRRIDPHFIDNCVSSGMSSGEGLIAEVADDEDRQPDKRRLVVESEFAQVMKVLSREGNTLSPHRPPCAALRPPGLRAGHRPRAPRRGTGVLGLCVGVRALGLRRLPRRSDRRRDLGDGEDQPAGRHTHPGQRPVQPQQEGP